MNDGNGVLIELHPEAVSALAQQTAARQASDRELLERVDDNVITILAVQRTQANQIAALSAGRFIQLAGAVAALILLGSFAACFVWLVATHH